MKETARYALHIKRDGTEVRLAWVPDPGPGSVHSKNRYPVLVHEVVVLQLDDGSLIDQTTIKCPKNNDGSFVSPRARGKGWSVHDATSSDNYTIWRRPHVPEKS